MKTTISHRIAGLYAIVDSEILGDNVVGAAEQAVLGGARVLQYRDKKRSAKTRRQQAISLQRLCHGHQIPLIINDDVELALAVGAAGVHLGKDDVDITIARAKMGDDKIIGVSCYNELRRAQAAERAGADYVAFGSFYASRSKPDAVAASTELLVKAKQALSIPIVAIGGITVANAVPLIAAGADAVAVINGIFATNNYCKAAEQYAMLFA